MLDLIVLGLFVPLAVAAITVMSPPVWAHIVGMLALYVAVDAVNIGFLTTQDDVPVIGSLVLVGAWIFLGARSGWRRKYAFLGLTVVFWAVLAGTAYVIVTMYGNPVVWYGLDVLQLAHTGITPIATLVAPNTEAVQAIVWYACAPTLALSLIAFIVGRIVPPKKAKEATADAE